MASSPQRNVVPDCYLDRRDIFSGVGVVKEGFTVVSGFETRDFVSESMDSRKQALGVSDTLGRPASYARIKQHAVGGLSALWTASRDAEGSQPASQYPHRTAEVDLSQSTYAALHQSSLSAASPWASVSTFNDPPHPLRLSSLLSPGFSGQETSPPPVDDSTTVPSGWVQALQHAPPSCRSARHLIAAVQSGLHAGRSPAVAPGGLGGAYYLQDAAGRRVGLLKPTDEEPMAPNNPHGYVGRAAKASGFPGGRRAIPAGEAGLREVAAYLLDHQGFAGVPCTCLVAAWHPALHVNGGGSDVGAEAVGLLAGRSGWRVEGCLEEQGDEGGCTQSDTGRAGCEAGGEPVGLQAFAMAGSALPRCPSPRAVVKLCSLQQFVEHEGDTSECGASRFPVASVHRIAILDIRLFNTDRHSGNILVRRLAPLPSQQRAAGPSFLRLDAPVDLVPIDHGYCLPDRLDAPFFEWLHWPQAALPFSAEELCYIASLDAERDAALLAARLPGLLRRRGCLRVLRLGTAVLQRGAARGLTAADIGAVVSRDVRAGEEGASELEAACVEALRAVQAGAVAVREGGRLRRRLWGGGSGGEGRAESVPEEEEEEEDEEADEDEDQQEDGDDEEESGADSDGGVSSDCGSQASGVESDGEDAGRLPAGSVEAGRIAGAMAGLDLQQALVLSQLRLLQKAKGPAFAGGAPPQPQQQEGHAGLMFPMQMDDDASPTLAAQGPAAAAADGAQLKSPSSPMLLASASCSQSSKSSPFICSSPDDPLPSLSSLAELAAVREDGSEAGTGSSPPAACVGGAGPQLSGMGGDLSTLVAAACSSSTAKAPVDIPRAALQAGRARLRGPAGAVATSSSLKIPGNARGKPKTGRISSSKRMVGSVADAAALPGEEAARVLQGLATLPEDEWEQFLELLYPLLDEVLQRKKEEREGCAVKCGTSCRF